jgi:hypothetical protein
MYTNNLYGTVTYGSSSDATGTDNAYVNLMAYLPDYYQDNRTMTELQTMLGYGVGGLTAELSDTIGQCFIDSATWGLDRWEQVFGFTIDKSKSFARRREILKAKLRGTGTTTKAMIQNVATAFTGGEVNVLEYPEEYRVVVQFVGVKGIPSNMAGLMAVLEEIKPAHLAYSFKYTYTTWGMISTLTWSSAAAKTWDELKIYEEGE